jgi:O-acetyl-ADP-ribose deacetylase (regulator of RNase III)
MSIYIDQQNLLNCKVDALVNTVNCVGIMGKGIALQFKQRWPENFKAYASACKKGEVKIGKMFTYMLNGNDKPNFIINFPTKIHWRNKSELSYITEGLDDLIKVIKDFNIKSIAIPALGCGNGNLDWNIVYPIIKEKLAPLANLVEFHIFEPDSKYSTISEELEFPKLTIGRALLIHLVTFYHDELDFSISKAELQKLGYFAKESGYKEMNALQFEKGMEGPYSAHIENFVNEMVPEYLQIISDDSQDNNIEAADKVAQKSSAMLETDNIALSSFDNVKELISGYTHPYGMELLSSVHWVAKHESCQTDEEIVTAIHNWGGENHPEWSKRKQILLEKGDILEAVELMRSKKWI